MRTVVVTLAMTLALASPTAATADEIKVWTARAIATVLAETGGDFERATGHRLIVSSDLPPAFLRRANAGEPFDLFISGSSPVDEWIRDGRILGHTRTEIARSGIGVAMRAGAPKPDISTVDAFKRTLLNAKSIAYLKVGSGVYLDGLLERLGIRAAIASRVVRPDSDIVSELVATGQVELGLVVITQIMTTPGVDLAGPLPREIQSHVTFVAGVSSQSKTIKAANELVAFLTGPRARAVIKRQGMEVSPARDRDQRFTVAIVRPDGALVPFAAHDAGPWERAWPEAEEATGVTSLDAVPSVWRKRGDPVPRVWTVWPASGGTPIQARVGGIEVVKAHCSGQVALKTNLPGTKAEHPLKFGIALDSSSVPVGAVEEVRRSDAIWAAAERVVLASFSALETAEAIRNAEQLPHETPAPVARITALYREAKSPRSPLYVIAEKKYRTARSPQDPQCNISTIMTGWLVPRDDGTLTWLDPKVFLTDCDLKGPRTGIPLAAFRISDQLVWVLQEHGYEDETYLIVEIGALEVRYPIEFNGGGC